MFKFPRPYRIALIAPAGACDEAVILAGKTVLENCGNEVMVMPHISTGGTLAHLAATDEMRAADINAALADERIDLLWAVRGGCGCLRILDKIDWQLWQKRQLPLAGFSDITALHWAMAKNGINRFLAAPMMKFLAENRSEITSQSLFDALSALPVSLTLPSFTGGVISNAPLLPGNLAVASALCGTGFFPDTAGKVLILEEVGEAPYRIDRMLAQLRLAGAFENCAGIIFGDFTDCGEVPGVMAVLQDFSSQVSCPVFYGMPYGHELPFYSLSGSQLISISPK